jgi:tetratricopeptide (TPR) repeat protein
MKRIFTIFFFLLSTVLVSGQQYVIDSLKSALHTTTADTSKIELMSMLSLYYGYNNMDSALFYGQQIINLSQKENYTYGLCDGYLCLSRAFDRMGNYPDALKMALRGLQMAEQIREDKKSMLLRVYNQLGTLYMLMKQFPDAKASLRKSIENVTVPMIHTIAIH